MPRFTHFPEEVLSLIFSLITTPSPTDDILFGCPEDLRHASQAPVEKGLKSVSLVSHTWRRVCLPFLFTHVVWRFTVLNLPPGDDMTAHVPILDFLRRNSLAGDVQRLTIVIAPNRTPGDNEEVKLGDELVRVWGALPPVLNENYGVRYAPPEYSSVPYIHWDPGMQMVDWDANWLWHTIFALVDPLRITLAAPPEVLGYLINRHVKMESDAYYNNSLHLVSLARSNRSNRDPGRPGSSRLPSQQPVLGMPCDLFAMREWTSLVINETPFVGSTASQADRPSLLQSRIFRASDPSMERLYRTLQLATYSTTCSEMRLNRRSFFASFPKNRPLKVSLRSRHLPGINLEDCVCKDRQQRLANGADDPRLTMELRIEALRVRMLQLQ